MKPARPLRPRRRQRELAPQDDPPGLRYAFNIALGVRKGDAELRDALNEILRRRRADIDRILDEYHVPRLPIPPRRQD